MWGGHAHKRRLPRAVLDMPHHLLAVLRLSVLGKETEGTCCGKTSTASWGVTFRRRHTNDVLRRLYSLRAERNHSLAINAVFTTALSFKDMSYTQGGGPSLLRIQGAASVAMKHPDSRYSFLWSNDSPSTDTNAYDRDFVSRALANEDVKKLLPLLYQQLQPSPTVVRERYRAFFHGPAPSLQGQHHQQDQDQDQGEEEEEDEEEDLKEVTPHAGSRIGQVVRGHGVGPLPEHAPGMPSGRSSSTQLGSSDSPLPCTRCISKTHSRRRATATTTVHVKCNCDTKSSSQDRREQSAVRSRCCNRTESVINLLTLPSSSQLEEHANKTCQMKRARGMNTGIASSRGRHTRNAGCTPTIFA